MSHKHFATAEERSIFGIECYECEVANIADYTERCRKAGEEMDKFFQSLPRWVSEEDQFSLWMMTDSERETWLMNNSPYLKNTTVYAENAKTVKLGSIIVR
jgi:hypothetical protein